ncbi:putative glutathione S-transferase parA [Iris pallida]|uniref:Glutathione S-transferase parA n=1 Tax=Iris pallida TaxID=29817 RepID=A0AAX6G1U7_IRIPA|nr:putative glutathione S-transferase parA [Iris pallida]
MSTPSSPRPLRLHPSQVLGRLRRQEDLRLWKKAVETQGRGPTGSKERIARYLEAFGRGARRQVVLWWRDFWLCRHFACSLRLLVLYL